MDYKWFTTLLVGIIGVMLIPDTLAGGWGYVIGWGLCSLVYTILY